MAPIPPTPGPPPDRTLLQIAFPAQANLVMFLAVVLGTIFVASGVFTKLFTSADVLANAIAATGIGLVLAAFGGQANAKFGSFVLAGVAAITGFLLYFLADQSQKQFDRDQSSYVFGKIAIDSGSFDISLKSRTKFYGLIEKNSYGFVALMRDVKDGLLELSLADPKRVLPYCRELDSDMDCEIPFRIPQEPFDDAVKSRKSIEWKFVPSEMAFYDSETNQRVFGLERPEVKLAHQSLPFLSAFITSAHAQENATTQIEPIGEITMDPGLALALERLRSDDVSIRRDARDTLALGPIDWVSPIAQAMVENADIYRVRLGGAVALAEMLRYKKEQRKAVQEVLSHDQIDALLKAASDKDRTLRIYASEFLYDLADPRSVAPALELVDKTDNPDGKYNLILVVSSALGDADPALKSSATEILKRVRPQVGTKTQMLVDRALERAK